MCKPYRAGATVRWRRSPQPPLAADLREHQFQRISAARSLSLRDSSARQISAFPDTQLGLRGQRLKSADCLRSVAALRFASGDDGRLEPRPDSSFHSMCAWIPKCHWLPFLLLVQVVHAQPPLKRIRLPTRETGLWIVRLEQLQKILPRHNTSSNCNKNTSRRVCLHLPVCSASPMLKRIADTNSALRYCRRRMLGASPVCKGGTQPFRSRKSSL